MRLREQRPNRTGTSLLGYRYLSASLFAFAAVLFGFNILYCFETSNVLVNNDSNDAPRSNIFSIGAYKQSFGLFDDISEPMWERMRDRAKRTSWYANPGNPLHQFEHETAWLGSNLYPNSNCPHVEIVGGGG